MSNIDIKQDRIAKRYADGLFASAKDSDKVQDVFDNLMLIQETLEASQDLKTFLENPIISHDDKKDAVIQIFKSSLSDLSFNFLLLLIDNNRFEVFNNVVREYSNKINELNNIIEVNVISAVQLNDDMKEKLINKLKNKTSKNIIANYRLNPDIIAGLVIEINDKTIDTSLKTKLNNLKKQLI